MRLLNAHAPVDWSEDQQGAFVVNDAFEMPDCAVEVLDGVRADGWKLNSRFILQRSFEWTLAGREPRIETGYGLSGARRVNRRGIA